MKYMLDTDIASYFMNGTHPAIDLRMNTLSREDVCVSAITKCELLFGVETAQNREKKAAAVERYLRYMQVLDFPSEAATEYSLIRSDLQRRGKPIGPNDTLIAAHARHLGLTLVTNNTREFSRVPGLLLENWADPVS